MGVISRGFRNAFRNVVRTVSIVVILGLSIGLSLAMLVAYQAVSTKISAVKGNVGNTVSISPAGMRGFEGGGDPLTQASLDKVAKLANVSSVNGVVSDRLTTSNSTLVSSIDAGSLGRRNSNNSGETFAPPAGGEGRPSDTGTQTTRSFTPPVTLVGTNKPTDLSSTQGGGTFKLTSGKVFDSGSTENVAIVGSNLATKNNLKVGSTFTAYSTTVSVMGIFDAGNAFSNNQVIMPLATVQTLSSQVGQFTSATATVNSISNVDSVTTATTTALGTTADVTNAAAQAQTAIAPLENIQKISMYSLFGAVGAGAVIILLTMVMIVRERRREIGVLKAIGASNIRVVLQFAVESVTFTLLASVVGIGLGIAAANPITSMLVTSSATDTGGPGRGMGGGFGQLRGALTSVQGVVDWKIVFYGLGVALIIAVIGSVLASFFITKIRPAEVMRAE
ncbi:MAG: FtsX-like permease family protein [bacterium]